MSTFKIPCFQVKKILPVDAWAESHITLPDTGPFRFDATPFFHAPTVAACDTNRVCRVCVSTPAQCGKTQMIANVLCYNAIYKPATTIVILDSQKTAQRLSSNRVRPFLREFGGVASLQRGSYVEDRSSSVVNIRLGANANLLFGSSRSASDLCSTPAKYIFLDELDRFAKEIKGEGDPIHLAMKRAIRFNDSMCIMTSTPTTEEGNITKYYLTGTQEVWCVRCVCGALLSVPFDDIDFKKDIPTYTCTCGKELSEDDIKALEHTYAPPANDAPFTDAHGRIFRSFRATATLMHNFYTWDYLKKEEIASNTLGLSSVRAFRNTTLGEIYKEPTFEITDFTGLMSHRVFYTKKNIPKWVDKLYAGIDTQDHLFEIVVVGMSENRDRIAFIDHRQIVGELEFEPKVWDELKRYISSFECIKEDGEVLNLAMVAHDAGGHFYNEILALGLLSPLWRPVKGRSYQMNIEEKTIIDRITRKSVRGLGNGTGRVDLAFVNTRYCKDYIYNKLFMLLQNKNSGFYFTADPDAGFDENFFEQITSEVKEPTTNGYFLYKLKPGFHNECLDCTVYALAASEIHRLMQGRLAPIMPSEMPNDEKITKTLANTEYIDKILQKEPETPTSSQRKLRKPHLRKL